LSLSPLSKNQICKCYPIPHHVNLTHIEQSHFHQFASVILLFTPIGPKIKFQIEHLRIYLENMNSQEQQSKKEKALPQVYFNVSNTGVTITSERLQNARFIPFDFPGSCRSCAGDEIKIDYCISIEGIHLFSNRFKGNKYVSFDAVSVFPDACFFSVKCKGRIFNIANKMEIVKAKNPPSPQMDKIVEETEVLGGEALPAADPAKEEKDEEEEKTL
jgi:hypothetical protein